MFKIKDGLHLHRTLAKYGFTYCGNYHRGDNWERRMPEVDSGEYAADPSMPVNGIMVNGDWNNRKISFIFPYRTTTQRRSVEPFIKDMLDDGVAEEVPNTTRTGRFIGGMV